MLRAIPLPRFILATALIAVPPVPAATPPAAAAPAQATALPEPICIPWIICHVKLPGRLTIGDAGGGQRQIKLLSWSWGKTNAVAPSRLSSDPEEGGQIAARTVRKPSRPTVSELTVSKKTDVASTTLMRSANGGADEPGKLEYPNVQASAGLAEPPPSGTLTIVVARGSCAAGAHIPEIKLSSKGRSYMLRDVDVIACGDSGDNTDTCTLSYQGVAS
jgi:hypothetical protein